MAYWVAQTQSLRERFAAENIKVAGYEVYAPRVRHVVEGRLRETALFPSYVFVRSAPLWSPVAATMGVVRLLRSGDVPAKLEDAVVLELQHRERNGFVRLPKCLRRGDTVRVLRGTFTGKLAIYDGQTADERERILLELLGRKVPLVVAAADIEKLPDVAR